MPPIKVLVVDDSAFMRQVISHLLSNDPEITVVGTARDGEDGLQKLSRFDPDVITLDLQMPKMDGLTFLARVMAENPKPIVVVSSWAIEGAEQTLKALDLGAVDFLTKPVSGPSDEMWGIADELLAKVKTAAQARVPTKTAAPSAGSVLTDFKGAAVDAVICCIAASTGGPRALQSIVNRLPASFPVGVLLVQHMPFGFTQVFAAHLAETCPLPVREATNGDLITPGKILVAPSGLQTQVTGSPGRLRLKVGPNPASVFRPSADVTFASIAESCGRHAIGVILTGMGQDGAKGLLGMRKAGARTLAESGETCVVHGMPRAAADLGAAEQVLPLWDIPEAILAMVNADAPRRSSGVNEGA